MRRSVLLALGAHNGGDVLSGRGVMALDGTDVAIDPGTAVLTRTGSSHGLKQAGREDLVILINYLVPAK